MVFSSPVFLFFFLPCVLLLFFLAPHAIRTALLFLAGLAFYAWGETFYVFFLLASICANWLLALAIARAAAERSRRALVVTAVVANLSALAYFKYAGFLVANADWVVTKLGLGSLPIPSVHLPIGISFVTFEAISYIVDVYRGTVVAQRNPVHVGFFMSFFPHLIAGPVLRFSERRRPTPSAHGDALGFRMGVRRFIIGLAKKVLVANTVGRVADEIFGLPATSLSSGAAWFGAVCYALQIYFDFSGYSDMAIGLGRMFGFELPRNFNCRMQRRRSRTSGAAGTSRCRAGSATTSTSRSAAIACAAAAVRQPVHRLPPLRALARRELDLRRVGRVPRVLPGARAARAGAACCARPGDRCNTRMRCSSCCSAGRCSAPSRWARPGASCARWLERTSRGPGRAICG